METVGTVVGRPNTNVESVKESTMSMIKTEISDVVLNPRYQVTNGWDDVWVNTNTLDTGDTQRHRNPTHTDGIRF